MLRLPKFRFVQARSAKNAAEILHAEGPSASLLAGGTDLFPNMKRRQMVPGSLIGLRGAKELYAVRTGYSEIELGSMIALNDIESDSRVSEHLRALHLAAGSVATLQIRNMGTLGGNLCLDTRCNYYDQSYEWRKAIDFCMKKDGQICWVAPSSPRCWAVSSTDTAPALLALRARVWLTSVRGERVIPLNELYADDGISYLNKKPDEILTRVLVPMTPGAKSTYWKLRRRGSFDFPVLSVAVMVVMRKNAIEDAEVVLGAVASKPMRCETVNDFLRGKTPTASVLDEAGELASAFATPLDNTDFALSWRKKMVKQYVTGALKEVAQ